MLVALDMAEHDRRCGAEADTMCRLDDRQPFVGRQLVGAQHSPDLFVEDFRRRAGQGAKTCVLQLLQERGHRQTQRARALRDLER